MHIIKYRLGQVRQQLGFVAPLSPQEQAEVAQWLPASAIPLFQTMSPADQCHSLRVCQGLQARGCTDQDMLAAALLHDVGKAQGRVPFWTRPVIVLSKKLVPGLLARLVVYPGNTVVYADNDGHAVGSVGLIAPNSHQWEAEGKQYPRGYAQLDGVSVGAGEERRGEGTLVVARGGVETSSFGHRKSLTWRRSLSYAWYHADIGADLAAAAGLSERAVLYIRTHHQPNGPAAELHQVDEVS